MDFDNDASLEAIEAEVSDEMIEAGIDAINPDPYDGCINYEGTAVAVYVAMERVRRRRIAGSEEAPNQS